MQIRVGYELTYSCPQATPMILALSIHPSRAADVVVPDPVCTDPPCPTTGYSDSFDNWCTRIVPPPGKIRIFSDAIVNDSGLPDPVVPAARQIPVEELPGETLRFLLGSRYCETDLLSSIAWQLFGELPHGVGTGPGHLRLRAPPRSLRLWLRPLDEDGVGGLPGARRRVPRLRPPGDRVLPQHEHPGALLHRLPGRHRRASLGRADGLLGLVRGISRRAAGTPSMHATTSPRIGRIVIARGRDASDVAISTSFGPSSLTSFKVWTDEVAARRSVVPQSDRSRTSDHGAHP